MAFGRVVGGEVVALAFQEVTHLTADTLTATGSRTVPLPNAEATLCS